MGTFTPLLARTLRRTYFAPLVLRFHEADAHAHETAATDSDSNPQAQVPTVSPFYRFHRALLFLDYRLHHLKYKTLLPTSITP